MKTLTKLMNLALCAALLFTTACGNTAGDASAPAPAGTSASADPGQSAESGAEPAAPSAGASTAADSGQSAESGAEPADSSAEVTTLSVFLLAGQMTNEQLAKENKWVADYLRENLHLEFDFRDHAGADMEQVYATMLASRDMTDLITFNTLVNANQAAAAGLLMDLNAKKELLPNMFAEPLLQPMQEYISDLNGGSLPYLFVSAGPTELADCALKIRWDLYQQLGKPAVNTLEDLIPLFKQMLELEPARPDGSPTYATGYFSSWDSNMAASVPGWWEGFYGRNYTPNLFVQLDKDAMSSRYADGSNAHRVLSFLFELNQAGILDPDSNTQTWDTYDAKMENGAYMCSFWPWHGSSNILKMTNEQLEGRQGYAPLQIGDAKLTVNPDSFVGDQSRLFAAGADAPDAALRLVDFIYSREGQDILENMDEGLKWTFDENGERRGYLDGDPEYKVWKEVGLESNTFGLVAFNTHVTSPKYGDTLRWEYWLPTIRHRVEQSVDPIMKDWRETYGALTTDEFVAKSPGSYKVDSAVSFMAPAPEDIELKMIQVGDVVKTNVYKMIVAANRAEFDALWEDLKTRADAMGLQDILDWSYAEWDNAKAIVSKYK